MLPASKNHFPGAPFSRKAKHSCGPGPAAWHCACSQLLRLDICKGGQRSTGLSWTTAGEGRGATAHGLRALHLPWQDLGALGDANGHPKHLRLALLPSVAAPRFYAKKRRKKKKEKSTLGSCTSPECVFQGQQHPRKGMKAVGVATSHARAPKQGEGEAGAGSRGRCPGAAHPPHLERGSSSQPGLQLLSSNAGPGTAARDRKWSPHALDHFGAGYEEFCIELEQN